MAAKLHNKEQESKYIPCKDMSQRALRSSHHLSAYNFSEGAAWRVSLTAALMGSLQAHAYYVRFLNQNRPSMLELLGPMDGAKGVGGESRPDM